MARLSKKQGRRGLRFWLAMALLTPSLALGQEPKSPPRQGDREPASCDANPGSTSRRPPRSLAPGSPYAAEAEAIDRACEAIASCKRDFAKVTDYSCTFFKKERVEGKLLGQNIMVMKARTKPTSFYFKFVQPDAGREAIYVAGRHTNKAVVHDVGFGKLIAGTLKLDPKGSMAMEDCRHPITEAGIGHMIDTIETAWSKELHPEESRIIFHEGASVGDRPCVLIESIHPEKRPNFMFHKVKVYIDVENNMPIRFEAYDWPRGGKEPELVEEYIYSKLKLNVGLQEKDFDPANSSYSFGRF